MEAVEAKMGAEVENVKFKVMIVCTHLAVDRSSRKDYDIMQPMAGMYIASLLDPDIFDVRLYHEMYSGPYDIHSTDVYDLVFLSGLQKEFDRMKQLSYVFRKQGSTVVAGGSICTLYPDYSSNYFDVVCAGGVECVEKFVDDFLVDDVRQIYRVPGSQAHSLKLNYDLLRQSGISTELHLVEASRGCNYKCSFCTIPAEGVRHSTYDLDVTMHNIRSAIRNVNFWDVKFWYPFVYFIDNHFTINKKHVRQLCALLKAEKRLRKWGALFSQDMLADRKLIDLMADSKCLVMFVGIESLDHEFLSRVNKRQNLKKHSELMSNIDYAQSRGIIVLYGYLFDTRESSVSSMTREVTNLYNSPILTFPSFFSFVSPLLGTEVFWECEEREELRPNLNLRDLEGTTVAYRCSKDSSEKVTAFANLLFSDMSGLMSYSKVLMKTLKYIFRYRMFHPIRMYMVFRINTRPFRQSRTSTVRNYQGGTDLLDPQYSDLPVDISPADVEKYFRPTKITDENGSVLPWLRGELKQKQSSLRLKVLA